MSVELSAEQRRAVETKQPLVYCTAGAGSGKTRVLVERIAYLIETLYVSPFEIAAMTFTRAAAQEMRHRMVTRLGPVARRVTVGTMHGISLSLLKRMGDMLGLRPGILSVYNEVESAALVESLAREMGLLKGKTWKIPKKMIDATFSAYEQRGELPTGSNPAYALFYGFQRRCVENNALPYSGLIMGLKLLAEKGGIAKHMSWKHLLVDEAQDLDMLQWSIFEQLRADGCNQLRCR